MLDRPIKAIGMHDVKVALHPEVAVTVKVNVARSPEEADLQAQGVDVLAQMFEREAAPAAEELAPIGEEAAVETPGDEASAEEAPAEEAPAEEAAEAPAEAASEEEQPEG